jgi:chemotaxis signal transduction protein
MTARPIETGRGVRDDGVVCCTVGDEQYAMRGGDVRQIVRAEQMRGEPGRDGSAGTLELAGQTVPVFELRAILGRAEQGAPRRRIGHHIAVTGETGTLVGWLVDRIVRTPLSSNATIVPLPAVVGRVPSMWFEGLLRLGESSMLLLAPQELNPLVRHSSRPAAAPVAVPARAGRAASPMVVMFGTPALPACDASRYALSGRQIAAIVQPLPLIGVPGTTRPVTGVSLWRDAVVPVIDFRGPGDHGDAAMRRRHVIAQCGPRLGSTLVAFPVDAEISLHRPAAQDQAVAAAARPAGAIGMFDVNGEVIALLDLDALLAPLDATRGAQSDSRRAPDRPGLGS